LFKSRCCKDAPPIKKRKIAKRVTDALIEEAGARREGIIITFHEVSKESYASGGELMVDKIK
jgi:phenylpyruvate tautomerase PptA (4-oxalocrotonate tautomerase family)